MVLEILRSTPAWVFVLFAWLIWSGVQRLRAGASDVRRVWIAPVVFIVWGLSGLAGRPDALAITLAYWFAGAVIGGALGRLLEPLPRIDRAHRRVLQAASAIPLLRNVSLFGAHYVLQVAAGFQSGLAEPALAGHYLRWDIGVSGLSAGYFAVWAIRFVRRWRAAPRASPRQHAGCATHGANLSNEGS